MAYKMWVFVESIEGNRRGLEFPGRNSKHKDQQRGKVDFLRESSEETEVHLKQRWRLVDLSN